MDKMNIKGIIFDLDGVICSTDEYHYQAWKSIADEEGNEFELELLDTMSKEVDSFVHGAEQFDDLTMLCLEYIGPHEN